MRNAIRRLAAAALPLVCVTASPRAGAVEIQDVGGKPMLIDITNTSILNYHFDNRDDSLKTIGPQVNDDYGEWLDRLNIQMSWWRFRLGARIDSAVFFATPARADVRDTVADQLGLIKEDLKQSHSTEDPLRVANDRRNQFYQDLHTRYLRAIYPSKLFLGYQQPGVDITAGDFYVQLGRGLVFSVRKIDEVAVDTTVRGGKIVADRQVGPVRLAATLFGGQMNPLRVDETSGRRLNSLGSPLFFGFPQASDLETYGFTRGGKVQTITDLARPSYLEDSVFGGRFEVGTRWVQVAGNAAMLLRRSFQTQYDKCVADKGGPMNDVSKEGSEVTRGQCAAEFPNFSATDESKLHNRILNFSGSINVPSLGKHGDIYVEVAGQQMRDKVTGDKADLSGYAVYASASVNAGPVSISLEGKHYRSFYPLAANIDTQGSGFSAPEYSLVTYSQPPTAEPTYTEIVAGSPNVCITGGRGRVDYRFNRHASAYAWLGRYTSWSEEPANPNATCEITDKLQTNTWDAAVGTELSFEGGKSHVKAWIGGRTTDRTAADISVANLTNVLTSVFYHEGYIRYDLVKHLSGPFSLQFQGFHRRREEPISFRKPWIEGENYTALQWSPHLSAVFGYEYMAREECQPERPATLTQPTRPAKDVCHFVNGGITWRSAGSGKTPTTRAIAHVLDTVSVFVGQRRQAVRCVNGTCRQFPPFEGAKLEITSRF